MANPNLPLVEEIRKVLSDYKSGDLTFQKLAKDLNIPQDVLVDEFGSETGLVEEILNYEQQNLESMFSIEFPEVNAIDDLLQASKEISKKFADINPSITFDLRRDFPEARQRFVERRIDFVNAMVKHNFELGMQQGMYRHDLSAELISRLYISRLIDMHNPDFFPNATISFPVLFDVMFDTFVRGICTEEGKTYYEKKIKCFKF
jgi:hypothetical protein